MISQIFIFLIVSTHFENVYAKHDIEEENPDDEVQQEQTTKFEITTEVKIKDEQKNSKKNGQKYIRPPHRQLFHTWASKAIENLTRLVEENQSQIKLLNLKMEEKNHTEEVQEQTTKIEITNDTMEMAVEIKDESKNGKRNEKPDNLTSLVEENQSQIKLLSCWTNPVRHIENKIYWIEHSSSVHNYNLEGGWTFGNYNRRTVILTIYLSLFKKVFRCNIRIPN